MAEPASPTSPKPINYNLLTLDELVGLCKKRRIKLGKQTTYNKFRIIAVLKEDDKNPKKANMLVGLLMRMYGWCIPKDL